MSNVKKVTITVHDTLHSVRRGMYRTAMYQVTTLQEFENTMKDLIACKEKLGVPVYFRMIKEGDARAFLEEDLADAISAFFPVC